MNKLAYVNAGTVLNIPYSRIFSFSRYIYNFKIYNNSINYTNEVSGIINENGTETNFRRYTRYFQIIFDLEIIL